MRRIENMPRARRNKNAMLVTVPMVMQEFNVSKYIAMKLANEAGAVYKYGRLVRIDMNRLKEYFFDTYSLKKVEEVKKYENNNL